MPERVITLKGNPEVTETGVAGVALEPGRLVTGYATIALQGAVSDAAGRRVVLEREELGRGIDQSVGEETSALDATYAVGEQVKVGAFGTGEQFTGWLASGESVTAGDLMEAAADGMMAAGTTNPKYFAVNTVDAAAGDAFVQAEVL
jgi:hypothetical protein